MFAEEEDFTSILRDRSHIDETLRLATEEKAGDYAGEDLLICSLFLILIFRATHNERRWLAVTVKTQSIKLIQN